LRWTAEKMGEKKSEGKKEGKKTLIFAIRERNRQKCTVRTSSAEKKRGKTKKIN